MCVQKLGARKVVMFELGPIGCIPSVTRQNKHSGKCVEEINQLVNLFNSQLRITLTTLTSLSKAQLSSSAILMDLDMMRLSILMLTVSNTSTHCETFYLHLYTTTPILFLYAHEVIQY